MLNKFREYIDKNLLFDSTHKILLGVSGGIDSSVMADLFSQTTFYFSLAHCNFKLRADESDEDQEFVRRMAKKFKSAFYTTSFETNDYAHKHGISIQMAARELRYDWFKNIAAENGFHRIALAHNRNDVSETLLLNLIRGTGLKGLTGIKPINEHVIRPILFASRDEIEEYAGKRKLAFREDSSNNETKYHRNLLRNEIIPLMRRINPSLNDTLNRETEIFASGYLLYKKQLEQIRKAVTLDRGETWVLSIPKMLALRFTPPMLYDLLEPFEFSYSDTVSIHSCLRTESGKKFYSRQYTLLKDRNTLLIEKNVESNSEYEYSIAKDIKILDKPIQLAFRHVPMTHDFQIPVAQQTVALDNDKLRFPLKIRRWKEGDYFVPLGMKGRKKLSDFFIDRKINLFDKKKTWLLLSGDDIIWIIGYQVDDRYKIDRTTKNVLIVSLKI